MSLKEERKICSKHQLEIATIDLKQSTAKEDKYLCIKCLIEKIDIQNMALVDETKIMIKEMKNEQQTLKIKENQKRIEQFKQIECLIKQFKVQVEDVVDKILININSRIQSIEKDFEEYDSKFKISKFEDEVEILSKHYKGSFNYEIPLEFDKLDDDNQFYDSIQSMFQSFTSNQSFVQVIDTLQQNKKIEQPREIKASKIQNEKEIDKSKTPSLNIKCNKHGKEIITFNLDSNETQASKLICIDCIHNNDPIKYTSLQDACLKWDEFKGKSQDKIKTFQNSRLFQQEKIIQNLKQIREQHNQILNELIEKINNEQQSIQLEQSNKGLYQTDFYGFNQEQIEEITQILSKKDKFKALSDLQDNIEQEDQIRYNLITNNLISLFEFELLKREDILKISGQDYSNINFTQIEDSKIKNEIQKKIQKFNVYYSIFNQTFNLYKSIIQNIQDIQIQRDSTSKEQSEETMIETNVQFDEIIQKFTKNTIQIKRLLSIDQLEDLQKTKQIEIEQNSLKIIQQSENYSKLEQQFNSLQQSYNDLINQNEILLNEKQSTLKNHEKLKEDCNNFTSQIINLNQQLNDKQSEITKANQLLEQTKQQNQNLLDEKQSTLKNYEKLKEDCNKQTSQISNLNQQLNDKQNQISKANQLTEQIQEQFKQLQRDCQDITYLQKQIQIVCYNNQFYLQQQQQQQQQILDQYPLQLTFSQQFKHNKCEISQNGKVVVPNDNGGYFCFICDQMIPKHGLVKFAFKILDNYYVMIGIGFRDIIQKSNYYDQHGIGKGTYYIFYDGRCFNHDQQDKNDKNISFKFTTNDIIIIEVDIQNKYIKWIKQSTNESFVNIKLYTKTLNIDTSQNLYPSVNLYNKSKVEIISQFNK
ncbi:unnamed protein product [Paramecium sonneborni]|uniref:Uncharacterized protein n=1 Tax=Paramecium sonneborni TaxID=65129 RepID=A0A8S1RJ48_9CILI|nr:unnamed protein product [Paramecium sonneborni]